jgi:hypothetical protein
MLQYFVKQTVMVYLALFSTISGILFVSRQQPLPIALERFHLNVCSLPCWIGIVPGQTTIGEAYTLIKTSYHPSDYDYFLNHNTYQDTDWFTVTNRQDGSYLSVSFNEGKTGSSQTQDTVISHIKIIVSKASAPTLGDWYNLLGKPDALSITWSEHDAAPNIVYDKQQVRLTLYSGFDKFGLNTTYISVGTVDIYNTPMNNIAPKSYRIPWQGWKSSIKNKLLDLMLP